MEWWLRTCIYEININEKKQRVAQYSYIATIKLTDA